MYLRLNFIKCNTFLYYSLLNTKIFLVRQTLNSRLISFEVILNQKFRPAQTAFRLQHGMTVQSEPHAELIRYQTLAHILQDANKCAVLSLPDLNYTEITHKFEKQLIGNVFKIFRFRFCHNPIQSNPI